MTPWPKQVTSQTLDTVQKSCNIVEDHKSLWPALLYQVNCCANSKMVLLEQYKKQHKIAPSAKTNYQQCNCHYVYNKDGDTNSTKGCHEPILHWTYPKNNKVQTVQCHHVFLSWWWFINHICQLCLVGLENVAHLRLSPSKIRVFTCQLHLQHLLTWRKQINLQRT